MGFVTPPLSPPEADVPQPSHTPKREPTETFKWIRGHHDKILEYQFSLARWLMASLLIINGGGLLALPDLTDKYPGAVAAGPWFVAGIITAIIAGTLAWFNCNCITASVDHRTNWEQADYQESSKADAYDRAAILLAWASVGAAVASLATFTIGAVVIQSALKLVPQ